MSIARVLCTAAAAAALTLTAAVPASAAVPNGLKGYEGQPGHQAGPGGGSKTCSPGQHGNPQPGFKPGSC